MAGVGLFKGLSEIDLQDETGKNLELNKTPKLNAKDILTHRSTYTVVRIGAPPSDEPPADDAEPPADDAEKAVVSLVFTVPVPEAAEEAPPPAAGKK